MSTLWWNISPNLEAANLYLCALYQRDEFLCPLVFFQLFLFLSTYKFSSNASVLYCSLEEVGSWGMDSTRSSDLRYCVLGSNSTDTPNPFPHRFFKYSFIWEEAVPLIHQSLPLVGHLFVLLCFGMFMFLYLSITNFLDWFLFYCEVSSTGKSKMCNFTIISRHT